MNLLDTLYENIDQSLVLFLTGFLVAEEIQKNIYFEVNIGFTTTAFTQLHYHRQSMLTGDTVVI